MSTSRSSSASVRNPYDGYSSDMYKPAKNNSSDFDNEFVGVKCKCDLHIPYQKAWKEGTLDPGRRFFGCSRYKDPRRRCKFFLRIDPTYSERARDVIKELKMKLKRKEDDLHNAKVDMNFLEKKMLVLDEEVGHLRKKNEEANKLMKKILQGGVTMRKVLVLVVMFWMMFVVLKLNLLASMCNCNDGF